MSPIIVDPHWTAYFTALIGPLVAVGAVYIAWQNMRTAKHKIKIDLFEKRLHIYMRLAEVSEKLMRQGTFDLHSAKNEWLNYRMIRDEARWLFDDKMMTWIAKNIGEGVYSVVGAMEQHSSSDQNRSAAGLEMLDHARRHLESAVDNMSGVFDPYLRLYKL